jgi:hypothetical protein
MARCLAEGHTADVEESDDEPGRAASGQPRRGQGGPSGRPELASAYEQARLRFELAEAVRSRREELGSCQRQLAERAGMTSPASPGSRPAAPLPHCRCWSASPSRWAWP